MKSIVQSPMWAITPIAVKTDAMEFNLFFGKTLLKLINSTAPVKLNQ
ncbi:hypothetical protein [Aquimarina sp. 433]